MPNFGITHLLCQIWHKRSVMQKFGTKYNKNLEESLFIITFFHLCYNNDITNNICITIRSSFNAYTKVDAIYTKTYKMLISTLFYFLLNA